MQFLSQKSVTMNEENDAFMKLFLEQWNSKYNYIKPSEIIFYEEEKNITQKQSNVHSK